MQRSLPPLLFYACVQLYLLDTEQRMKLWLDPKCSKCHSEVFPTHLTRALWEHTKTPHLIVVGETMASSSAVRFYCHLKSRSYAKWTQHSSVWLYSYVTTCCWSDERYTVCLSKFAISKASKGSLRLSNFLGRLCLMKSVVALCIYVFTFLSKMTLSD